VLAELDVNLPPVLVHRPTMRVIDGMHRVRAAVLRGRDTIEVRFFDGTEDAAFILAVEANIAHGLPLSRADRTAAAVRIIVSRPHWSDRAIAASTGLSAKTVAAIRRRWAGSLPQPAARVGRDGRIRPVDIGGRRQRAAELINHHPEAPLRRIAQESGISVATARDVRDRISRGVGAVPQRRRTAGRPETTAGTHAAPRNLRQRLRSLTQDPSLRYTEHGRSLLRWFDARLVDPGEWTGFVGTIPPHSAYLVAELARGCAAAWREFADELRARVRAAD
jgi:ParB-like chromosome segregation protein Spo0J